MTLVDSHCHLDFEDFGADLDGVLTRAKNAGVATMVTINTRVSRFDSVRAIVERHDNIYGTVGTHPHEVADEPVVDAAQLVSLAQHPKVIGFGETGLDYFYDLSPREAQRANFRVHIQAARQSGLPLIVHTRDAEDDTIAILEEESKTGGFPGLIHCFSGTERLARVALSLGFYISISGIITFNKADDLRQVVAGVPMDRLLVETDAPYLAPVPHRGKRNEPAFVARTAARLAAVVGVAEEELARVTTDNFFRLFAKAKR